MVNFNSNDYSLFVTAPEFGNNAFIYGDTMTADQAALFLAAAEDIKRMRAQDPNTPPRMSPQFWTELIETIIELIGIGISLYGQSDPDPSQTIIYQNNLACQSSVTRDNAIFWRDAEALCPPNPSVNSSGQVCSNRIEGQTDLNQHDCAGLVYSQSNCVRRCF